MTKIWTKPGMFYTTGIKHYCQAEIKLEIWTVIAGGGSAVQGNANCRLFREIWIEM